MSKYEIENVKLTAPKLDRKDLEYAMTYQKYLFQDKKATFLIPDYQRPYAWGEDECKVLWEEYCMMFHRFKFFIG